MQKRHIPKPQAVSLMDITFESLFLLFCYCLIKYHCWLLPPVSPGIGLPHDTCTVFSRTPANASQLIAMAVFQVAPLLICS